MRLAHSLAHSTCPAATQAQVRARAIYNLTHVEFQVARNGRESTIHYALDTQHIAAARPILNRDQNSELDVQQAWNIITADDIDPALA